MNKEILKNILKASSAEFSYEEIRNMLDEELEKPEEEMDSDLIELCIEALSRENTVENTDKTEGVANTKKKTNIRRIFLIAAIVAVLSIVTVSAGADIFSIDTENGIVCIFGKQISLNIKSLNHEKVFEELKKQGIDNVHLLPVFLDDTCDLEIENTQTDMQTIKFVFSSTDIYGKIMIRTNSTVKYNLESIQLLSDVEQIEQININGTDVIVVSTTDSRIVTYYNSENSNYKIFFNNSSFEEVFNLLENYQ